MLLKYNIFADKYQKKIILFIIILSLLSSFFWSHKMFGSSISSGGDERQYNDVAIMILNHFINQPKDDIRYDNLSHYQKEALHTIDPFYPVFVAGVYTLFGENNFDAVRIVQIFIFVLMVLIIYSLVKDLFNNRVAFFSGILIALFPLLANMPGRILREILFTFLIVLLSYLIYKLQKNFQWKWFISIGIILGLTVLTNTVTQFLIIFIIFYLILILKKNFLKKEFLFKTGILIFSFLIIIMSWSLILHFNQKPNSGYTKNGLILTRKVEMMKNIQGQKYWYNLGGQLFGYYFFEGKNFNVHEFYNHAETTKKIKDMMEEKKNISEVNSILAKENTWFILHNIPQYFAISFLDFLQLNGPMLPNPENFNEAPMQNLFIEDSHPEIPSWSKIVILLLLRIFYWTFLGFVIYGLIKIIKNWEKAGVFIVFIVYFNLVYSAVFGIPRYALPIYPFYIILFVCGLSIFLNYVNIRKNQINAE